MADSKAKYATPPYATFAPFLNFLNKLRESSVPSRIDPSVFGNASGSLSYSVIAALKSLKLIESNGIPTPEFMALVNSSDDDRKPLLREAMKNAYPTLHSGGFPLERATASQFDEHLRENYEARGSTIDKVATFFIHSADYVGIPVSDLIRSRKPTSSNGSKATRRSKKPEPSETINPLPDETQNMSDKALEYKLVDLMREPDVTMDERNAIWVLLQYLTARQEKRTTDQ